MMVAVMRRRFYSYAAFLPAGITIGGRYRTPPALNRG